MKKHLLFRSFLALMMLLFVGNAWAQTTLLDYTTTSTAPSAKTDITAGAGTIQAGYAWTPDGTVSGSYGWKIDADPTASKATSKYVLAQLASGVTFQEGDIITLKGYSTSTPSADSPQGFTLYNSIGGVETLAAYGNAVITSGTKETLSNYTYTIASNDNLIGKSNVVISRYFPSGASRGVSVYFTGITITRPAPATKRVYLDPTSKWVDGSNKWTDAGAKTGIYDATAGKWLGLMNEGEDCYAGYLYYDVATTCETVVFARFNPNNLPSFPVTGWDITGMWSQSVDVNITTNDLFKMVGYGTYGTDEGKAYGETTTFSLPTYTVTYVAGLHGTGSMTDENNYACGNEATVLANGFTADANYSFAGYKDQEGKDVAAGDVIEMHKNLTLTAQWSLNADGTVVYDWNKGIGETLTAGSTTTNEKVKIHTNTTDVAGIKFANSINVEGTITNYVKISATSGVFKVGDVITFTGVYNNSAEKNSKIDIYTEDGTYLYTSEAFINGRLVNDDPAQQSYTLENDCDYIIIGRTSKNGESNLTTTWLTQLTVTRPVTKALTLSNVGEAEYGFATFCGEANYTVSGAKAYKAELSNNNELSLTELTGVIPAGDAEFANGVIIAGEVGATATITYTSKEATAEIAGNILLGTTEPTATTDLKGSNTYLMVLNKTTNNFGSFEGAELPANKACFAYSAPSAAPVRILMPGVKPVPTEINNNEESAKAIKTLIDGRLYILRDGNMFDLNGRLVK